MAETREKGSVNRRKGRETGRAETGGLERPGTAAPGPSVQQGAPTRSGLREVDGTDRAPEKGYQDEVEINLTPPPRG